MKKIYFLLLTGIMLFSLTAIGQKTVVVVEPDEGLNIGALNNAINSAADPGNTIFELKRGGLYLLNGSISHTDYTLHIRAEEGTGPRPVLQPAVDALGASSNHFNPSADLILEGLYIQGRDELGAIANRQIIVSGTAPTIIVDNCFFDYSNQAFLRLTSSDGKVFIKNSILRNDIRPENPNNGNLVDCRSNPQDTLSIENSTLYNFSYRPIHNISYTNFLNFDHNTVFQACYATNFNINRSLKANFTNNILYNFSYRAIPDIHYPLFEVDSMFTVGDKTDADRHFNFSNNNWYQQPEIGDIMDQYGEEGLYRFNSWDTEQKDTIWYKWVVRTNVFFNQAVLDTAVLTPAPKMVAFITAGQVDTTNIFSESLTFKNQPPLNLDYWKFYVENKYNIGSLTPPSPFADENPTVMGEVTTGAYDFSYNTSSKSATAAEGGLPLGASKWIPYNLSSTKDLSIGLNNVRIYPNPVNEKVTFEIESNEITSARIIISNILGKHIIVSDEQINQGQNLVSVGLDKITKPGIYLYQIQVGSAGVKSITSGKLIKL
ncbi:MAG: T9SS type A sorting domain-containing protein [Prolixibacteraceae bacterium]|nr:T9SS type A sorting domain-containing protein [Prolixibacteraceae bacterium]